MAGKGERTIVAVVGREVLDSRGHPTLEAEITLDNGMRARAAVPSGASIGKREAVELRDGDSRYGGRGVQKVARALDGEVARLLVGRQTGEQQSVDDDLIRLDGTENKSRLGANVLLAASLSYCKATATAAGLPLWKSLARFANDGADSPKPPLLPMPMLNIINGGAHAKNNVDIQEAMIMPLRFENFADSLRAGVEVFHALKNILQRRGKITAVGDEGGFAPDLKNSEEAFELLTAAIETAGYRSGEQIAIAVDCAASEFYRDGLYTFEGDGFRAAEMIDKMESWVNNYPVISIEDGCADDDWDGWQTLTNRLGARAQIVGDDLFATHPAIIQQGIQKQLATAALIKPNQIGTLSEMRQAVWTARAGGLGVIFSHRSGDTEESEIADMAVAFGGGQIKAGAPCRGERTAKYNRLLRIADELNPARYADLSVLGRRQ